MKKLATLMLGLSILVGSVAVTFASQDTGKKKESTKAPRPKKGDKTKDKTGN